MSVSRIKSSRLSKCHAVRHSAPPSSTILETSSLCKLGRLKNHFTVSSSQAFPSLTLTTAWKHCCSGHVLHWIMSHSMSRTLQLRALWCLKSLTVLSCLLIMAALRSSCGHYIFVLWFLLLSLWSPYVIGRPYIFSSCFFFFFPRLISAVGDWMSTILGHMVWS